MSGQSVFPLVSVAVVATILGLNHFRERLSPLGRRLADFAIIVIAAVLAARELRVCIANVIAPTAYDFPAFYNVARAAAMQQAFYRPDVLRDIYQEFGPAASVPDVWITNVASYWYFPPSALLLVLLGFLDYREALVVHYLVQGAFFVGAAIVIHKMAPTLPGVAGLFQVVALLLAFRPTHDVFIMAQLVFGALFCVALAFYWLDRKPLWAGVVLGIGFFYKHLLLIPAFFAPLLGRLRTSISFLACAAVFVLASLYLFGFDVYDDYLRHGPDSQPAQRYVSDINQSLLSTVHKLFDTDLKGAGLRDALLYPPFFVILGILTLATAWLCRRGGADVATRQVKFTLILALSLLAHPGTLYNTVPIILPGLIILYSNRKRLPVPNSVILGFILGEYALANIVNEGAFAVLITTWIAAAGLLLAMGSRKYAVIKTA